MNGSSEPKAVIDRYLDEVLNAKDLEAANELISNEAFIQRVVAFLTSFPDLHVTAQRLMAEGSVVAVHLSAEATHLAPFQGMPATGKRWVATCTALYEVFEGRISDAWVNWDLLSIMEQIGAVRRAEGASA